MTTILNSTLQHSHPLYQSASVDTLLERLGLENITPETDTGERMIEEYSISRPSFQLTGFFDFFAFRRVQIIGKNEYEYMNTLNETVLAERLDRIASYKPPCIIVSRDLPIKDCLLASCKNYGVPLLRSKKETSDLESELIKILRTLLAPRETVHGVLIDVDGVGVLIRGDSGIGKSEAALELIRRGHRLVSDDVVEIRKVSDETLVGLAPELSRDFMEVRGIGIINVREMFGYEAVKESQNIDMIINLEEYTGGKNYDRFGLEPQYDVIMGNEVIKTDVPVRPGRNLAAIVESAAINYRARIMGCNAPQEFMDRINRVKNDVIGKKK